MWKSLNKHICATHRHCHRAWNGLFEASICSRFTYFGRCAHFL